MPFSPKQIRALSSIVRKAWTLQNDLDLIDYPGDLQGASMSSKIDFFRRTNLSAAVGQTSYSDCHAIKHYLLVKSHFQRLAGERESAELTRQREEFGSAATHSTACSALAQIQQACREGGFDDAYVHQICRAKFGGETDLRQLTEKQLWHLCFTLRNRASKKRSAC